jgi:outer membrane protein assembly factor BamB
VLDNCVVSCTSPGLLPSAWPTASRCASHQGRADVAGPATAPAVAWAYPDPKLGVSQPPPVTRGVVIGAQDSVYFATEQGIVVALTKDGALAWSQSFLEEQTVGSLVPARFTAIPTLGADGRLYAVSQRALYVLDTKKQGALRATLKFSGYGPLDANASPVIGPDGTVFVGFTDGYLYAASAADNFAAWKWPPTTKYTTAINATPAMVQTTLYLVGYDGTIFLFDIQVSDNPVKVWSMALSGKLVGNPPWPPTIGADGSIYVARPGVGGVDGTIMQYNPDSLTRWDQPLYFDGISSGPVILPDGNLLMTRQDGTLTRISAQGQVLGSFSAGGALLDQPVADREGRIFVRLAADLDPGGMPVDNVRAFAASGQALWSLHLGSKAGFAMAIDAGGRLLTADEGPEGRRLVALH